MLPLSALIAFSASASLVISTNAKRGSPVSRSTMTMDLRHLSVGLEQPPKLFVRHLRTQVSNKMFFTIFPYP